MKNNILKKAIAVSALALSFNVFAGGCSNANLAAWTDVRDDTGTRVNVVAPGLDASACTATFEASSSNADRARVQDRTPACETSYRAAFLFNVDSLGTLASNERTKFFNAQCNANDGDTCGRVGQFQFRLQGDGANNNILRSFVIDESVPNADARRKFDIPVSSGVNTLEIQWIQASSPVATDGVWRVWINNSTEASPDIEYTDVQNGESCIGQVGLGLIQATNAFVASKADTPFSIDTFESRRQTGITVQ
ncbi:hypothetical protein [Marinicella sp. W31]|uniref:hypothetical protein n=1 Tax=Marinicella sp. W31 TaxID=3023713 RepID=UPI003756EC4D